LIFDFFCFLKEAIKEKKIELWNLPSEYDQEKKEKTHQKT
jgi:hypothetical protein